MANPQPHSPHRPLTRAHARDAGIALPSSRDDVLPVITRRTAATGAGDEVDLAQPSGSEEDEGLSPSEGAASDQEDDRHSQDSLFSRKVRIADIFGEPLPVRRNSGVKGAAQSAPQRDVEQTVANLTRPADPATNLADEDEHEYARRFAREHKKEDFDRRMIALEDSTTALPAMSEALEKIQRQLDGLSASAGPRSQVPSPDQSENDQPRITTGAKRAPRANTNHARSYYSRAPTQARVNASSSSWKGYASDSSSEGEYQDTTYATGHDDDSSLGTIVPFHSRPPGPPHVGLRSIKPANKIFDKLMSYRSYRLKNITDSRSSRSTAEVRIHIKNLSLVLEKHIFDGTDPIRIFDFLSRFVNEADMLSMSEAQAFIALPMFLEDPAETQFRTNLSGASRRGGLNCWPEAVQHLLRTYATAATMREALENLRQTQQNPDELEQEYRKRLSNAIFRCGNVHSEDEKMMLYVDGLSDTIRMPVARFRESIPRKELTFEDLCQFANAEDTTNRARMAQLKPITQPRVGLERTVPRSIPRPQPRGETINKPQFNALVEEERTPVLLINDQVSPPVDATPSDKQVDLAEEEPELGEDLYLIDDKGMRRKLPPRINFDDGRTSRVGWIVSEKKKLICHSCYEEGHISPQCPLKLFQLDNVVRNYETLTEENRAVVPDTAYANAKAYLSFKKGNAEGSSRNEQASSKN